MTSNFIEQVIYRYTLYFPGLYHLNFAQTIANAIGDRIVFRNWNYPETPLTRSEQNRLPCLSSFQKFPLIGAEFPCTDNFHN